MILKRMCCFLALLAGSAGHTVHAQTPNQAGPKQKAIPLDCKPVSTRFDSDGALTTDRVAGNRKLSLYDDGGSLDCRRFKRDEIGKPQVTNARVSACERKARTFIWEHWLDKKRGYIRVTGNSVDATATKYFFIEPDHTGNWQVILKIVREGCIDELPAFRTVQRRDDTTGFVLEFRSNHTGLNITL